MSKEKRKIAVLIPCYNEAQTIEKGHKKVGHPRD